ncbi:MAG: hypothetical protein J2P46_10535, partial [Zavarzinella sp.]|nr:hypothetical protein [Zavarzinella sp.]
MNPLTKLQMDYNRGSADGWAAFADHRKKVTELLGGESTSPSSRLCVLGAGNCNDLDLNTLLRSYREVHLVDLDAEALARGVARQGLADEPGVHRHGGVDLTGILDTLAGWSPHTAVPTADVAAWAEEPVRRLGPALPAPFEVVASTCLLSQLIGAAVHTV